MMIKRQTWNNIPIPTREMFELITDALIGQDIHTWERKSLINERFFKMQHLACRLNTRIKEVKSEMTRWIEDVMKRTFETCRKTDLDVQKKTSDLDRRLDKEHDQTHAHLDRLNTNLIKHKKEMMEQRDTLQSYIQELRNEMRSSLKRQQEEFEDRILMMR